MPNVYNPYLPNYMNNVYQPAYAPGGPSTPMQTPLQPNVAMQRNPYESSFIWIEADSVVDNYLVAPGSKVYFMKTDLTKFYVKSTDPSGKPMPVEVYSLARFGDDQNAEPSPKYLTVEEFEKKIDELTHKFVIRKENRNNG